MSSLIFRLFGPPRIERDGVALDLDHRKPLALLTYLLVTATPHSREALAGFFWPDYPNARNYLRNNLSIIRQVLGDEYDHWVAIDRQTVEWRNPDDTWVDISEFERHMATFRGHVHTDGDLCGSCVEHLAGAVALASDEFLAGFTLRNSLPFDEWSYFHREDLRTETAVALDALARFYGKSGNLENAVAYARHRLTLDDLHEPTHRQLMELYARNNQHSLALHQYEECVRLLRVELAVEPAAETQSLMEAIKRRALPEASSDFALQNIQQPAQGIARVQGGEDRQAVLPPHNLPSPLTPFIGRQQELAELRVTLIDNDVRLLTLTGPGGVGKTRLSQAVAADLLPNFIDGLFFVTLATIRRPDLLPSVIAETLSIAAATERSMIETLTIALGNKQMLLVLDNFEHILSIAPVVTELLRTCPQIKVLATSREALRLTGEHEFVVHPLTVPESNGNQSNDDLMQVDAIQLFAQRARQARQGFKLDADVVPIVVQICRRLDGLPLAIELAAARTKHFTLPALLTQLNGISNSVGHQVTALNLLKDPKRDVSERHHSLRTAIAWSYDLLADEEQTLFRRLSIFVGGWSVDAAQAICLAGLTLDIWDGLASLLDKHLILRADDGSPIPRFAMLETLREFGLELLRQANEENTVRAGMADYFLDEVKGANAKAYGPEFAVVNEAIRLAYPTIRTALDWATEQHEIDTCLRYCSALHHFWDNNPMEADRMLQTVLNLAQNSQPSVAYAGTLASAGFYAFISGRHAEAYERFIQGLSMNDSLDKKIDPHLSSMAHGLSASCLFYRGEYAAANARQLQGIAAAKESGNASSLSMNETAFGRQKMLCGAYEEAGALIEQALQRLRKADQAWGIAKALVDQGQLYVMLRQYADAKKAFEESLALCEKHDLEAHSVGAHEGLGLLALRQADYGQAAALLIDAVVVRHRRGGSRYLVETIEIVAELAVCTGQSRDALRLAGAAATLRRALSIKIAPIPGATLDRIIDKAQGELGPAVADRAGREGSSLSLDNAVALALKVCHSV